MGNSKKFWKNIQSVIPNRNGSKAALDLIDKDTNTPVQSKNTANFINDYFINIGPKLARQYDTGWDYVGPQTDKRLTDIETNLEEIIDLCKEININKSSSIENLSSEV